MHGIDHGYIQQRIFACCVVREDHIPRLRIIPNAFLLCRLPNLLSVLVFLVYHITHKNRDFFVRYLAYKVSQVKSLLAHWIVRQAGVTGPSRADGV